MTLRYFSPSQCFLTIAVSLFDFVHICRVDQRVHRLPIEVLGTVVQQLGDSAGQEKVRRENRGADSLTWPRSERS